MFSSAQENKSTTLKTSYIYHPSFAWYGERSSSADINPKSFRLTGFELINQGTAHYLCLGLVPERNEQSVKKLISRPLIESINILPNPIGYVKKNYPTLHMYQKVNQILKTKICVARMAFL